MIAKACIPLPLQIVIDDVGWFTGRDGHADNQPFRTGISRNHVKEDYLAIVQLGRSLNMCPAAAMILSEWDVDDRLRTIPTASWMGRNWKCPIRRGPQIEEIAGLIRSNRDHYEVTMHGLGHEYWLDGKMVRAEWHDMDGQIRAHDQVMARLNLYVELVQQHQLGPLPRSFVPCAFLHHFCRPGENLAEVLKGFGIRMINTPYYSMKKSADTVHPWFGFDHGIITVDRGFDPFNWLDINPEPKAIPKGPTLGMHWPQLLHPDPARNHEVVDRWIKLLAPLHGSFGSLLSPNTPAFCRQLAHHCFSTVKVDGNTLTVDASGFFALPWVDVPIEPVCVKVLDGHAGRWVNQRNEKVPVKHITGTDGPLTVMEIPVSPASPITKLSYSR